MTARVHGVFITCPTGRDGKFEVSINIDEIASFRSAVVVSYSHQDHTIVVLKQSGVEHDCRISKAEFEQLLVRAQGVTS